MPGPDPDGLEYDETPDGRPIIVAQVWRDRHPSPFSGCARTRLARARAVLLNLHRGGWMCPTCGDPVPIWRRADAVYCSTGCRKREARKRRKDRAAPSGPSQAPPARG